jgi:hypothetical protein
MAEKTQMERPLMDGEANGDEGETKWYLEVPIVSHYHEDRLG